MLANSRPGHSVRLLAALAFAAIALIAHPIPTMAQKNSDCLGCHSDRTLTKQAKGRTVSLFVSESSLKATPHGQLDCISCHTGLDINKTPHAAKIKPVQCVDCHDAKSEHTYHKQMVPRGGSPAAQSAECKNCHGTHMSKDLVGACGNCHSDVKSSFMGSAHGRAVASKVDGAPGCFTCHRKDIVSGMSKLDPAKLKIAQEKVCLSCHVDNPKVTGRTIPKAGFVASYEKSVHSAALAKGNAAAANCVDCHGSHEMQKGINPGASVNRANIPQTCGKCHSEIASEYEGSVHGVAAAKGSTDVPVCTTCHGEHKILKSSDPNSPVSARNVAAQVCGTCHNDVKLSEKYDIRSDRFKTFSDSYHGLAIRNGSVKAANCASCHSAHNIRPSSDPASTVNPKNLPKTCGQCHPGANKRFAVGKVHVSMSTKQEPVLYVIGIIYGLLIAGTIGGMFAHNALDLYKKWRRHVRTHDLHGLYVRMTACERIQHGMLALSFIVLVITGFMLHYPDAWWVKAIRGVTPHFFDIRSGLHRIAAVVMLLASAAHVFYVAFTQRGKQLIRDLFPARKDVTDVIGMGKYLAGLSKEKPKFGRFSYIEKSEYWALIWGTVVMSVTGIVMWKENFFIGLFTKLGWDISRSIHFYEAWLAALAILVWHMYFIIFNPDVYPMNAAWLTGTLPEDVVEEEHPLEYESLKQKIKENKPRKPKKG